MIFVKVLKCSFLFVSHSKWIRFVIYGREMLILFIVRFGFFVQYKLMIELIEAMIYGCLVSKWDYGRKCLWAFIENQVIYIVMCIMQNSFSHFILRFSNFFFFHMKSCSSFNTSCPLLKLVRREWFIYQNSTKAINDSSFNGIDWSIVSSSGIFFFFVSTFIQKLRNNWKQKKKEKKK